MLNQSTFNIVALFSERALITQPRIPPQSRLDQPLTTQVESPKKRLERHNDRSYILQIRHNQTNRSKRNSKVFTMKEINQSSL